MPGASVYSSSFGAKIVKAPEPVHGKTALITHQEQGIFKGLKSDFIAARYHSLVVEEKSLPSCFKITASYANIIMALEHREIPHLYGIQFHPESFLTRQGDLLVKNFLSARC